MGEAKEPKSVKGICGLITCDEEILRQGKSRLSEIFGKIDAESLIIPFDFTLFYEKEMGKNLIRQWVSFEESWNPGEIALIKIRTNELEKEFSEEGKRKVNIDPGYIDESKLVLATTKNCAHRIYISNGIYCEVTLVYNNGKYQSLDWTYPDYRKEISQNFFIDLRRKYLHGRR